MTHQELRVKFLNFFNEKGHRVIPSSSLIPEHDPTVLFITAGMHPLVPFLLGEPHPNGKRLTNIQKCLRTDDLAEVGDNVHNTFFEMLGNWSLGDYWKEKAIEWSYEFLTKELNLDPERLYVSVFAGDNYGSRDEESAQIWQKLGIAKERIFYYDKKHNWWGPAGKSGPCGPATEMFYDTVGGPLNGQGPSTDSNRFVEIWNDVFMEYDKKSDGTFEPLKQKNVDTGMGLERILMILQGKKSIYETDVFSPILEVIGGQTKEDRMVADHLRSSVMLVADGVEPSNKDRGYVLRRLIRRAMIKGKEKNLESKIEEIVEALVSIYKDIYPNILEKESQVVAILKEEATRFSKTLKQGLDEFNKLAGNISGKEAFDLYQTYGFPIELTEEVAYEKGIKIDKKKFEEEFKKHQDISRAGITQRFAGGLADQSEKVIRGHTATHLLHQALRDVLGESVYQTGSNITSERVRFDFSYNKKLTEGEIKKVEEIVNQKVKEDLKVHFEMMPLEEAKKVGAIGLFEDKYAELVKVYFVGDYSKEFCGGPHVEHTAQVGEFKIVKEEALGKGQRRIRAVI